MNGLKSIDLVQSTPQTKHSRPLCYGFSCLYKMLEKSRRFEDLSLEENESCRLIQPGSEFWDTWVQRRTGRTTELSEPNLHIRDTQGF